MESSHIYRRLGARIRQFRKEAGLTQAQLATQIGISRASLANIEAGRQQVLVHHLYAIAEAVDIESPAALLTASQPTRRSSSARTELPISAEGLTEKQRQDVLRLMSGGLQNDENEESGDE